MDHDYTNKAEKPTTWEHKKLKFKVCGMNRNTSEVANLKPDYLGFIFWGPSKRKLTEPIPDIPHSIKKVGVFVDASVEEIIEKIKTHQLLAVQLHGQETAAFCKQLIASSEKAGGRRPIIIKVFSIAADFNFDALSPYEDVSDFYLFDTKGKLPGGNGFAFDWKVLEKYPATKPYFLSGGIGLEEIQSIKEFLKRPESRYCHAIDVNSRFELAPGLKDIDRLEEFKRSMAQSNY